MAPSDVDEQMLLPRHFSYRRNAVFYEGTSISLLIAFSTLNVDFRSIAGLPDVWRLQGSGNLIQEPSRGFGGVILLGAPLAKRLSQNSSIFAQCATTTP
jgi:hypothetical protein